MYNWTVFGPFYQLIMIINPCFSQPFIHKHIGIDLNRSYWNVINIPKDLQLKYLVVSILKYLIKMSVSHPFTLSFKVYTLPTNRSVRLLQCWHLLSKYLSIDTQYTIYRPSNTLSLRWVLCDYPIFCVTRTYPLS